MALEEILAGSTRYREDGQLQSAWPFPDVADAIARLVSNGRAIVALAATFAFNGKISEGFPTNWEVLNRMPIGFAGFTGHDCFRVFTEKIKRNLGEGWPDFVRRSGQEATAIQEQLYQQVQADPEVRVPTSGLLLCRLSWNSEVEWKERYGQNKIQLHEGEPDCPKVGQDESGITYHFIYPDEQNRPVRGKGGGSYMLQQYSSPTRKRGRMLFDLAEHISGTRKQIAMAVADFLMAELKKSLPSEKVRPEIVGIRLIQESTTADPRVVVLLDDTHPEGEMLYQYWQVELKDLQPWRRIR